MNALVRRFLLLKTCARLAALALTVASAQAQTSAVFTLKSRAVVQGNVTSIGPDSLTIALPGAPAPLVQPYHDIERIDWPESDAWNEAVAAWERAEFAVAAGQFAKIAAAAPNVTFHPAPGNFRDRALRLRVECLRRLLDAGGIADAALQIAWDRLPPGERDQPPTLAPWIAIAKNDWPSAKTAADAASTSVSTGYPDFSELSLLRGRIAAALGDPASALVFYGSCYALPGASPDLAAIAIREAAAALEKLPDRKEELRALTHLYATIAGKGNLWEGAPETLVALHREPPPAAIAPKTPPPAESAAPAPTWATVLRIQFEPPPATATPPPKKSSSKAPAFDSTGGRWFIIDAPAEWPTAGTKVGKFDPSASYSSVVRALPANPHLTLAPGRSVRFTFEYRIQKFDHAVEKDAPPGEPMLRFGIATAGNRGYGLQFPLSDTGKSIELIADTDGDDSPLGGPGVTVLPRSSAGEPWMPSAGAVVAGELTLQMSKDGAITLDGKAGDATVSATADDASGITDFSGGRIVLRVVRSKSIVETDNLTVEISPAPETPK
jgi:hypothetical protein